MKTLKPLAAVLPALGGLVLCLALVLSLLAILARMFVHEPGMAQVTIANGTNEAIVDGAVEALGTSYPFSNVGAGQEATISFPITGEGDYRVRARLASGRTVDSGGGRYLASAFDVIDRAVVAADRINIRSIRPFRVKLLMKDGSETLTPQITNQPLPELREVIDVEVDGRPTKAMAHLLTWPDVTPSESSVRAPIVIAVEIN